MAEANLADTLKDIDEAIESYRADIVLGEALERLKENPDFKLVILDGYIDSEAKRLFKILTDPSGRSLYSTEAIHMKLASISDFKSYIGASDYTGRVKRNADNAVGAIAREQDFRSEETAKYADGEV